MKIQKNIFLAIVALAASVCVSQAQLSLQVRIPFTDTGGGTTAASDTSTGGSNVVVQLFNNGLTPADFQGVHGSGVSGLGVALDFSTNSDFALGAGEGAAAGLGPVAVVTNSALNFGTLSNYTTTIWFKANAQMPNTGANNVLGPRIFTLGANGIVDKGGSGVTNSVGIFWLQCNQVAVSIGGSVDINTPTYATFIPTNQWLFYAFTVSNGTNVMVYGGTDQTNVMFLSRSNITVVNGIINLTNAAGSTLLFGNRSSDLLRGFDGWINDFRFYAGAATTNQLEDIRWSAVIPTGFSAISGLNEVNLAWNALGGAASYNVLRSNTSGSGYSLVASGLTSPNYSDTTTVNGNTYYYVITAVDAKGSGNTTSNSAEASVFVSVPPAVPTGLNATHGDAQVVLSWNASIGSPAAASYNVARSSSNGGAGSGGETLLATNVTTTGFTDTGLTNGITYYYEVSAVNASGSVSAYSTEANAIPVGEPLAPVGLASRQGNHFSVVLKWTDPNPTNIQSTDTFTVQRSPDDSSWTTLATGVSGTNYTDTTTANLNTYYYQVFAVNTGGTSVASSATSITVSQVTTLLDTAEQTVRAAANANIVLNDNNQGSGASVGFLRVKWVNDATPSDTTSCAKTYFRWSFANQLPNTNADLQMTWSLVGNSQNTSMILWSLNQPYPFTTGLTGSINADGSTSTNGGVTWNNAQANDTNYNGITLQGTFQMLTNGTFTATKVAFLPVAFLNTFPGAVTVTIPAPWGNLVHNNELVLCLGGTNDAASQSSNGYRIANNVTSLIYNQIAGNNPPTMSVIPNMTVTANTSGMNSFTITDPDGNVANLTASAAIVSDPSGVISEVSITGSGANESVVVTASGTTGTATVEVTVTDENGDPAQRTFNVTVVPAILPPTISTPPNTNTLAGAPVVVPFTIGDVSENVNTLAVSASVGNSMDVLVSAITNGSGANWTVTVTPVANTNGIGIVNLSVTDTNGNTTATSFAVLVQSSAQTAFSDVFDYPNGSLFLGDDGIWTQIGPSGGVLTISGGVLDLAVNLNGDVAFANLLGAPYAPGSHALIYVTFTANWSSFTPFSWLSLATFGGVSATHFAAVGNVGDSAADGGFNATIANNGADAVSTNSQTLFTGTTYDVAVRYDVDTAQSTLWINATNEVDTNGTPVTANDVVAPASISGHYIVAEWRRWRSSGCFGRPYGFCCHPAAGEYCKRRRRQRANHLHGGCG